MKKETILNRGDIIVIDFDPQAGKEINKSRPALVISPKAYNVKSALILCCPITSTIRRSPWEVMLPKGLTTQGAILVNQIKSLDKHERNARKIEHAPDHVIDEVISKILTLVS